MSATEISGKPYNTFHIRLTDEPKPGRGIVRLVVKRADVCLVNVNLSLGGNAGYKREPRKNKQPEKLNPRTLAVLQLAQTASGADQPHPSTSLETWRRNVIGQSSSSSAAVAGTAAVRSAVAADWFKISRVDCRQC